MRRLLIYALFLLVASYSLSGCAADDDTGTQPETHADAGDDAGDVVDDAQADADAEDDAKDDPPPPPPPAEIVSMTVSPSELSVEDASDDSRNANITIRIANFSTKITRADAFIQLDSGNRNAPLRRFVETGDEIHIDGVTWAWFEGLLPGDYSLGATVRAESGRRITATDLATVTITE